MRWTNRQRAEYARFIEADRLYQESAYNEERLTKDERPATHTNAEADFLASQTPNQFPDDFATYAKTKGAYLD